MKAMPRLVALGLVLAASPALAYTLWGVPYGMSQVPVRLTADPTMAPQCPTDYTPFKRAGRKWNNVDCSYFAFNVRFAEPSIMNLDPSACDGKNHIEFAPIQDEGVLAVTWITCAYGKRETGAMFNSNVDWACSGTPGPGEVDLQTVALHEFGHMLGLGHSSNQNAILWPMYVGPHRWLANDDKNGACFLYPQDEWPGSSDEPGDPVFGPGLSGGPDPAP